MRKFIPIIFVAVTLLVGCKSATMSTTTTASATPTNAVAATPPAPVPNTPAQTTAENNRLGDLGAAFIVILTVLAVKRG